MENWNGGFPEKLGGYRCKVDGTETFLLHKWCPHNGKHRWMTTRGEDVIASEILWKKKETKNSNE